ncbi:MAG: delta-60 repeat domain-containing protein [Verrucomicrobia bacterium]|nr:delta-60 repeat domain-containing protein [Verrucomicrobiota bacterium]
MKHTSSLTRKAALLLFSVAVLLAGGAAAVRGQSALDGFDPHANGTVQVVVVQPDGKILIGGNFTSLSPNGGVSVTRNRIARLNPDGTLDSAFNPNANNQVTAIAVQADGKIVVGGIFTSVGGQTRTNIARLDATTGLADLTFNPGANIFVGAIAIQSDGMILVGGLFTSVGGQARTNIARLDATGAVDLTFNPSANNQVTVIVVQADGMILVGGAFTRIGGQTRNRIARLDATGAVDLTFDPNANSNIFAIALQADGKILVGGVFSGANSIGGQPRNFIARLDATTGVADSFNPNASDTVESIVVQADGKILAGGFFTTIGGQTRNRIARLNPNGTLDTAFNPGANDLVFSLALQADGKILVGGAFTTLAPNGGAAVARNNIARLETGGLLDRTLNLNIVGSFAVSATAVQPDGKILIGGSFTTVLSAARTNIARLNTDGTLDFAFNPNVNNSVTAIAVQADGKVLIGGDFTSLAPNGGVSVTRNHIARLNPDGTLDSVFDPNANSFVGAIAVQADGRILVGGGFFTIGGELRTGIARLDAVTGVADSFNPNPTGTSAVGAIAIQSDGKILVGGLFSSIGGQARTNIARLDAITGAADSFNPNANADGGVDSIAVQADGKILAGGFFTSIGGQARTYIARLDAITGAADSFNPSANGSIQSIAVQADGKILVGGVFTTIGGATRNNIARLDPATGLADSFIPEASGAVLSIAVQADGKILAGGGFTTIGGQTRNFFARLSNDTSARHNLAVTQTTVTWILGGSSPQFTRVTFEDSADGVNYNFLGNGTATGNNWTLTGLNLSIGQNLYIRARGYYRSGRHNGSESITESVRNVFLTLPPPQPLLNIQRSANTDVVLSWATNFTGFTLEANTNLTTNVWSTVTPAPSVSGTNNVVTNAASESGKYYRLRAP